MIPSEGFSPGEVGRALVRIEGDVREVKTDLKGMAAVYVTRPEFEAHREASDREFKAHKETSDRELKGIKNQIAAGFAEVKAQRAPWWVVGTLAFGGTSTVVSLIALYK